jgi:hypothetical protein
MSVEKLESGLNEEQTTEVLRRRREYDEHPERFDRMDKKSLDRMFNRVRIEVASRLQKLDCQGNICQ